MLNKTAEIPKVPNRTETFKCKDIYVNDPDIFSNEDRHCLTEGTAVIYKVTEEEISCVGHFMRVNRLDSKSNNNLVILYYIDDTGQLYFTAVWRNCIVLYISNDCLETDEYVPLFPTAYKADVLYVKKNKIKLSVNWYERRGYFGSEDRCLDNYEIMLKRGFDGIWNVSFKLNWHQGKDYGKYICDKRRLI